MFPPSLNFGFVSLGTPKDVMLLFQNRGEKQGKVKLKIEGAEDLKADMKEFTVDEDCTGRIMMTCPASRTGIVRGIIRVYVDDVELKHSIDVSATVVEHSIAVVLKSDNRPTTQLDFGPMWYGNRVEIPA